MNIQSHLGSLLESGRSIIITGSRGGGKSTYAQQLVSRYPDAAGGVLSRRCAEGYALVHIPTGKECLYCASSSKQLQDGTASFSHGRFWFSPRAFGWGLQVIDQDIASGKRMILIDEIGPVELQDRGFYDRIRPDQRKEDIAYLLVIRDQLLDQVCSLFHLDDFYIHTVRKTYE